MRRCLNPFHRSVSLPRSSNRTCGFAASGFPTGLARCPRHERFVRGAMPRTHCLRNRVQLPRETPDILQACRLAPVPCRRLLRKHPEVRPLPSTGVTRLLRYYEPLRLPAAPPPEVTLRVATPLAAGSPTLRQKTFRTCCSHYPGGLPRVHLSVLPRGMAASLPFGRSRRPRLHFRGLHRIHSRYHFCFALLRPARSQVRHMRTLCPQSSDRRTYSSHRLGSYRSVPTLLRVELSSTGLLRLSWRTRTPMHHRPRPHATFPLG